MIWLHSSFELWLSTEKPVDVISHVMVWRTPLQLVCTAKSTPFQSCGGGDDAGHQDIILETVIEVLIPPLQIE
jgi:hypothetical protein